MGPQDGAVAVVMAVAREIGPSAHSATPGPTPLKTAGRKAGTARQGTQQLVLQWALIQPLSAGIVASQATDTVTARSSVEETKPGLEVGGVTTLQRPWLKRPSWVNAIVALASENWGRSPITWW